LQSKIGEIRESSLGQGFSLLRAGVAEDDKVSEPTVATSKIERNDAHPQPTSPEETRRQARENWLRLRQQGIEGRKSVDRDRDAGRAAEQDQSHSLDNEFDE